MSRYDIVIAGGGIVGLATALQLLESRPGLRIAVLEKEDAVAMHQSSRNSGVIHSGIYYKPGSLRARNCLRGYGLMLRFCREHDIPHDVCGKVIVAVEEGEREGLDRIFKRGRENGLEGIRKLSPEETREIEPHVQAVEAVWVPQAGIVNYGTVARKYAELIAKKGAEIHTGSAVRRIVKDGSGLVVETPRGTFAAGLFINCTGLYSDAVARMTGSNPDLQILPFRGEYYELIPGREHLVRNLIYPVPNPNFPFLGVHFTRMIDGGIEAGPNAVLAFRREGYGRADIHAGELAKILAYPGFRRLAARYWRDGWAEMKRSFFKKHFVSAMQRLIPEVTPDDVRRGRSGVRAMACGPDGQLLDDFRIMEQPGIINVCNAPSPAATASLAIGETLAQKALAQC